MGRQGTHVALETADVVLVHDQLSRLPWLVELGRKANRLVRQSLAFALAVIAVLVYANLTGHLTLTLGVLFHEGSTLLVALNGLRVLRLRSPF
jgi:Cd2+/Zn2+-exporting ATPase